ncbi:MAG: type I restriction endonuclease subunit R, partial [Clostridia bacterium]|nr:type I restriction endonuclease subunit R [Clostridia bacterium]
MRETEQEVITQVFSKSCKFNLEREVVPTCNYTGRLFAAKREVYDVEVDQLNGVVAPLWERAKITSISENGDKIIVNTEITVSAILEVDGSYIHREFLIPCEVEVNSDGVLREYLPKVCVKNVEITCNNSIVNIETEVEVCLYAFYNDVAEIITKMEEGDKKSADYASPMQINEEKYRLLRDGIPVTVRQPGKPQQERRIQVFDFRNPENNHFLAIKELQVHNEFGLYRKRPDILGFVNGLPLLFVELKNFNVDVRDAYTQNYTDYLDTIPHLFHFNAFVMLSNGYEAKV